MALVRCGMARFADLEFRFRVHLHQARRQQRSKNRRWCGYREFRARQPLGRLQGIGSDLQRAGPVDVLEQRRSRRPWRCCLVAALLLSMTAANAAAEVEAQESRIPGTEAHRID